MISPNPPTRTEIIILIVLSVVSVALLHGVMYTMLKIRYQKARNEILKLEIIILKLVIIDTLRLTSLWLIMTLPLIGIVVFTNLSAILVIDLILAKVQSFPLLGVEIVYLFLSLYAAILLLGRFLVKYGSIYKLPFMFFARNDARQYLENHKDIHMILFAGSITYIALIINLLMTLVDAPSIISKEFVGIIVVLLLIEVLPNKKYENAINLCKKFTNT